MTKEELISTLKENPELLDVVQDLNPKANEIDSLKAQIKELRDENAKRRISAKEQAEKEEEERLKMLAEQKKYKELYETLDGKLKTVEPELNSYKSKYEALESSLRTKLLDKLPEKYREKYGNLDLATLQDLVDDLSPNITKNSLGTEKTEKSLPESLVGLDSMKIQDLKLSNPEHYKKLLMAEIAKGQKRNTYL